MTREGFYEIHRANGRQELVAVHADRRESDLTPIPQETLDLWRNTGQAATRRRRWLAAAELKPAPGACGATLCYWCLITAIIESVFASRYLSVEKEAHERSRPTQRVPAAPGKRLRLLARFEGHVAGHRLGLW